MFDSIQPDDFQPDNGVKHPAFWENLYGPIFKNGSIYDWAVLAICGLSFGMGWIESIVNTDNLHWGLMYGPALDVHRGLLPYGEVSIIYGWLTTWIQSLFIGIIGEKFISIGIATALFYSCSLWLSYRIFLRFLPKYFAFFSVFCIFLIHPYFIYAWSNYYSYTFLLAAILFMPTGFRFNRKTLMSGVCLALAMLCRYSSAMGLLPPFLIYFWYELLGRKTDRKQVALGGGIFLIGLILPLCAFAGFLLSQGVLDDFWCQNRAAITAWSPPVTLKNVVDRLSLHLFDQKLLQTRDARINFFSINFVVNVAVLGILLVKSVLGKVVNSKSQTPKKLPQENQIVLVSLFALCSYLNSYHIYEVFRLINGASLGFGVVAYGIWQLSRRLQRPAIRVLILIPIVTICFVWANGMLFQMNSSTYNPWSFSTLSGAGRNLNQIAIFRGKLFSPETDRFYSEVFQILSRYDDSYSVVNSTTDSALVLLKNLPRIQKNVIPVSQEFDDVCCQNASRINPKIASGKAIIFSYIDMKIPGYQVIFKQLWPIDVPFLGRGFMTNARGVSGYTPDQGNILHVMVPVQSAASKP